jgi:hypothetical protein|nr:hypothetical protein [Kofleriaceae bacterium]
MRLVRLAVVIGLGCGLALADGGGGAGTRNFDAAYVSDMSGGPWLCPEDGHGFSVSHGRFSIPWQIRVGQGNNEHPVTVAHIDGVIAADGTASARSTAVSPVPADVAKLARDYQVSLAPLDGTAFHVVARKGGDDLEIAMTAQLGSGTCSTDFREDATAAPPPDDSVATTELDCTAKPYAVAAWSAGHPYGEGAYTQWSAGPDAPDVYRCAHGCAANRGPADNDDTWLLVGRCAAAKLPAQGAAKWDATYKPEINSGWYEDWRCPDMPDSIAVVKGKVTIPWNLRTYKHDEDAHLAIGHLDVVIRDDGTATVQPVVTIDALPRGLEYNMQGRRAAVTVDALRGFRPAATFYNETDVRTSSYGVGRRAEVTFGDKDRATCKLGFLETGFKEQQFREQDGWRTDCNDDEIWDSNRSYNFGDVATVVVGGVRRPFTCEQSPRCDAGVRPDRGGTSWQKENRCR